MTFLPTHKAAFSLSNMITASEGLSYLVSSGLVTLSGTSETPLLYLSNSSANTISLANFYRKFVNTTSGHTTLFKLYWNPTISSAGTALNINNLRNNPSTHPTVMAAQVSPSSSSHGVLISEVFAGNYAENISNLPLIIDPSYSLLVTATTQASSDVVLAEFAWTEINF